MPCANESFATVCFTLDCVMLLIVWKYWTANLKNGDGMDDSELHEWFIQSFGPSQGEIAYAQFQELPEQIKDQILQQGVEGLPKPSQVQSMAQALGAGGLNTMDEVRETLQKGPINVGMATSLALSAIRESGAQQTVSASDGQLVRQAITEANLWLDSATDIDPVQGDIALLTRAAWAEQTLPAWCRFANPVASSTSDALSTLITQSFGDGIEGDIAGMYAGPVQIPIPDDLKDPKVLMKLLGNTAFGMQMGTAAGSLSSEVRGSFDQGIQLLQDAPGGLIVQNCIEYAHKLDIDVHEVLDFLALREIAHARLFAHVPWLMPRFEALIGKFARGIEIDLDAMREQLRDATTMDPEQLAGAVNMTNVAPSNTPEQIEARAALENLLALVEGWVDVVVWRAAMAYLPHLDQLREMMRRERAVGGPAERTFETLIGLEMRPKRSREAAQLWEQLTVQEGVSARDAHWNHPDLLPVLPADTAADTDSPAETSSTQQKNVSNDAQSTGTQSGSQESAQPNSMDSVDSIDWDAELSKLLADDGLAEDNPVNNGSAESESHADGSASDTGTGTDTDTDGSTDSSSDADGDTPENKTE